MKLLNFFKNKREKVNHSKSSNFIRPTIQKTEEENDYIRDTFNRNKYLYLNNLCPYCKHPFEKQLSRKTKCKGCNNPVFVRTHFDTKEKLLLTEEEVLDFDVEKERYFNNRWAYDKCLSLGLTIEQINEGLNANYSIYDILRGWLNEKSTQYMTNNNWSEYRLTRFYMAETLLKENKYDRALILLLEVCYLDINNPSTIESRIIRSSLPKEISSEFTEFEGFIAPGVMNRLKEVIDHTNMQRLFM